MKEFKLPRWHNLPEMELYLTQIKDYMNIWLGEENNTITKTMINNYVKVKLIPAPTNKKYSKQALARLYVISVLKSVYTIEEISKLINLTIDFNDFETSYDDFCNTIENSVKLTFSGESLIKKINPVDPRNILRNVSYSYACQLYVRTKLNDNR
jgi:DNA-binding transcriptional MerR regulator